MLARLVPFALVLSFASIGAFVGCSEPIAEDKKTATTGDLIPCDAPTDCPEAAPECRFGLCVRPCASNAACEPLPGTYCSVQGVCEAGCRSSSECDEGRVCAGGACVAGRSCGNKCDCDVGQVCGPSGQCEDPPATCAGPIDCPRGPLNPTDVCDAYACDGFSRTCQQSATLTCDVDGDCRGLLHCGQGCACTAGSCVQTTPCTVANEATVCGAGRFCDGNTCALLPSCADDATCAGKGLQCNEALQRCERGQPCVGSNDCQAPASVCVDQFCAIPTCTNGGITCGPGQACTPDGRCVAEGTGGPCTSDNQCRANEYCALVGGSGQCAVGCRSNADCAGLVCNAAHQCVSGGAGGQFGDACFDDTDCQIGLICGLATLTCAEPCFVDCSPGVDCCLLSGANTCFEVLPFFAFCRNL